MGEPRISQFPEPTGGGGGGGGGDSFWRYSAGTLDPDPATTTPLTLFSVPVDDGAGATASFQAFAGSSIGAAAMGGQVGAQIAAVNVNTDGLWSIDAQGIASREARILADLSTAILDLELFEGATREVTQHFRLGSITQHAIDTTGTTTEATFVVGGDGSFSLTADDGTNTYRVNGAGGDAPPGVLAIELGTGTGDAALILSEDTVTLATAGVSSALTFDATVGSAQLVAPAGIELLAASTAVVGIGTTAGRVSIEASDLIPHIGKLGTDQTASASVAVGTLANKLPIYDTSGTLLGYIPIYNSIT